MKNKRKRAMATFLLTSGGMIAAAVAASLPVSTRADATRKVVTGEIGAIDSVNRTISFSSGEKFQAGPRVKLSTRHIGEKVIVVYETRHDGWRAVKVRRAPQSVEALDPTHFRKSAQNPAATAD